MTVRELIQQARIDRVEAEILLADILDVFLNIHGIGVLGFWASSKGAKLACEDANIGLVDVDIGVEEGALPEASQPCMVGELAHFMEVSVVVQHQAIIDRERPVLLQLFNDRLQNRRPSNRAE